jgi:hypothetical protein
MKEIFWEEKDREEKLELRAKKNREEVERDENDGCEDGEFEADSGEDL